MSRFPSLYDCDDIRHFPKLGTHFRGHRGRDFQGLVNAGEVIGYLEDGERRFVHAPIIGLCEAVRVAIVAEQRAK